MEGSQRARPAEKYDHSITKMTWSMKPISPMRHDAHHGCHRLRSITPTQSPERYPHQQAATLINKAFYKVFLDAVFSEKSVFCNILDGDQSALSISRVR